MFVYGSLILVLATVLSSAWAGLGIGFHASFGSRPQRPQTFHPPHHDYRPPHREPCARINHNGSNCQWDCGQNKPPRPPPSTTTTTTTTTEVKSTTISSTTISFTTTRKPNFDICMQKCRTSQEDKPVCGSDGVTYRNPSSLKCAKECGVDVIIIKNDRCGRDGGVSIVTQPTSVPPVTPSMETIRACVLRCPTTSEYNPVCGSDGITYPNPSRLECAKLCGVDVTLSRCSTGGSSTSTTSSTVPPVTPSMEIIRACMLNCPTTPEYNPVCGSDGVTYNNPSRLECAKMCGLNVQLSRNSRCPTGGITSSPTTNATPNPTNSSPTTVSTTNPITNPTPTSITPPVTPAKEPVTKPQTPTTNGLDFTISKDILDLIFTTDYSGLIDERHDE